jgi:hypothetical protein
LQGFGVKTMTMTRKKNIEVTDLDALPDILDG